MKWRHKKEEAYRGPGCSTHHWHHARIEKDAVELPCGTKRISYEDQNWCCVCGKVYITYSGSYEVGKEPPPSPRIPHIDIEPTRKV